MKVVILAGGYGTRFKDETKNIPKPLIDVCGKPIICHVMDLYSKYNYKDFIICCGYKKDSLIDYFISNSKLIEKNDECVKVKFNDLNITLVDTLLNTMTGGRLKRIQKYVDDNFLMTYCDGLCNVNINELVKFHESTKKTVTLTAVHPIERFGVLKIKNNTVIKFKEKKNDSWINGGFMVINKEIFNYIKDDSTSLENDVLENLALKNKVDAFLYDGIFQCMDMHDDKDKIKKFLEVEK